jgi:hypothetical protein
MVRHRLSTLSTRKGDVHTNSNHLHVTTLEVLVEGVALLDDTDLLVDGLIGIEMRVDALVLLVLIEAMIVVRHDEILLSLSKRAARNLWDGGTGAMGDARG